MGHHSCDFHSLVHPELNLVAAGGPCLAGVS